MCVSERELWSQRGKVKRARERESEREKVEREWELLQLRLGTGTGVVTLDEPPRDSDCGLLIYLEEPERREGFEGPYYAISSLD